MKESELTDSDCARIARENHIWLNAFACVNPTAEFAERVGREVMALLRGSNIKGDVLDVEIGKVIYIRLNCS